MGREILPKKENKLFCGRREKKLKLEFSLKEIKIDISIIIVIYIFIYRSSKDSYNSWNNLAALYYSEAFCSVRVHRVCAEPCCGCVSLDPTNREQCWNLHCHSSS